MSAVQIAVIIPHYNDLTRLETCLNALAPQAAEAGSAVETLVVDNDSPCDLSAIEAAHPWARFLTEPRKGAAAARNLGVAESRAPELLFLDSDCVPASDWLATALGLIGKSDLLGGRVDTFDETPPPRSGAEAFEAVFAFHQRAYVEKKGFSVTANLLTRRSVFEQTGPMIVGVSEDLEWCQRATGKGYSLAYEETLVVGHPTRNDWAALRKKWKRTTSEAFQLNGASASARVKWAVKAVIVAASGVAHLPKVLGSDQLESIGDRLRGAGTLLRLRFMRGVWMLGQAATGRY